MAGTLTISPSAAPFPWSSAAIATFTGKAVLNFDIAATGVTLEIDGSKLAAEDEIVQTLAKAGGLSDDSEKVHGGHPVRFIVTHPCFFLDNFVLRPRKVIADIHSLPANYDCARLFG